MRLTTCRATRDERRRPMPGDAMIPDPMFAITHAITIGAPPSRVWPWLVQMGSDRAGWYSYDAIDNGGRSSAGRLVHELQAVGVGDVLPAVPGAEDAFVVAAVEPERALILTAPSRTGGVDVSWEHRIEAIGRARSRLIVRARVARTWLDGARERAPSPRIIERVYALLARLPRPGLALVAGAGHGIMEARHLRGIKRRVERSMARAGF